MRKGGESGCEMGCERTTIDTMDVERRRDHMRKANVRGKVKREQRAREKSTGDELWSPSFWGCRPAGWANESKASESVV